MNLPPKAPKLQILKIADPSETISKRHVPNSDLLPKWTIPNKAAPLDKPCANDLRVNDYIKVNQEVPTINSLKANNWTQQYLRSKRRNLDGRLFKNSQVFNKIDAAYDQ